MFLTDLNTIAEELMPILGWLGIGTAGLGTITAVIVGLVKLFKFIGEIRKKIKEMKDEANFSQMFQKALPKDFKVSITSLIKSEVVKLVPSVLELVRNEIKQPISDLNDNMQDNNKLLLSFRTIPDEVRKQVKSHLKEPYNVDSYVELEMSPEMIEAVKEPEKTEETPTIKKMYIE